MVTARKTGTILALVVVITLVSIAVTPSRAQQNVNAITTVAASLRSGPDRSYPSLDSVPAGTLLTVSARSDNSAWLLVMTTHGARGWASARQVQFTTGANLADLPVSSEIINASAPKTQGVQATPVQPVAVPTAINPSPSTAGDSQIIDLHRYPIIPAIRG